MVRVIAPSWSVLISRRHSTLSTTRLLERLNSFGVDDLAFSWIESYLSNKIQYVKLGNHSSTPVELLAGVPQGSVLEPLLFITYTSPLSNIIQDFEVSFHQYSDDTSLFSILFNHSMSYQSTNDWHLVNFLQLNPQKSEFMFICTCVSARLKTLSPHLP